MLARTYSKIRTHRQAHLLKQTYMHSYRHVHQQIYTTNCMQTPTHNCIHTNPLTEMRYEHTQKSTYENKKKQNQAETQFQQKHTDKRIHRISKTHTPTKVTTPGKQVSTHKHITTYKHPSTQSNTSSHIHKFNQKTTTTHANRTDPVSQKSICTHKNTQVIKEIHNRHKHIGTHSHPYTYVRSQNT